MSEHITKSHNKINTVEASGNEDVIKKYVKQQGLTYNQIYRAQLTLFDGIT